MKKYPVTEMHWVVTRLLIDLMKLGMEEDCSQNKGYRRASDFLCFYVAFVLF